MKLHLKVIHSYLFVMKPLIKGINWYILKIKINEIVLFCLAELCFLDH